MPRRTVKPVFRARTGFAATVNGRAVRVSRGQLVQDGDPLLVGRTHLFDLVSDVVEQATAAPGEQRSTPSRPTSPTSTSAPAAGTSDDDRD